MSTLDLDLTTPRALALLDPAECASTLDTVLGMRRFWTRRHPTAPSFTLGAACYLDVPTHGLVEYHRASVRGNTLLRRRFDWLYTKIKTKFEDLLTDPVAYTDRYALPGFHIFEAGEGLAELEPKLHVDLQDQDLDWEDAPARPEHTRLSFTIPIAIPAAGAGLHFEDRYVDYRPGEMLLHSGDRLHRISNEHAIHEGEARITLQGHGRRTNGTWVLYW